MKRRRGCALLCKDAHFSTLADFLIPIELNECIGDLLLVQPLQLHGKQSMWPTSYGRFKGLNTEANYAIGETSYLVLKGKKTRTVVPWSCGSVRLVILISPP